MYLGGNEQSTHEYVSKLLGKQTIDTNTYGQSKGRSGSYTTNFQTAGRELMTPDEVRMLDNRYALLFIRGERPVKDLKYNILKHPNVALTTDGQAAAYQHGTDPLSVAAVSINLERLKQAVPEDTDTGDYVILTEEEVYDFMRKKAQENNQNSNYQEETYENIINNIIHPTTRRTSKRLPMPENVRKGFRRYSCAVLTGAMILGLTMPAYAAGDPLTVVNNLSTFIFGLIRAVGLILLGWGIVQVGLSLQSHDPSQRSNGFLTLAGGIVITFAKEILDLIVG